MVLLFLLRRYADETAVHHQEGGGLFFVFVFLEWVGGRTYGMILEGLYIKYLCQNSHHSALINHNVLQCKDKLEKGLI